MDAEKELKELVAEIADAKEEMADAKGQMKVIQKNLEDVAGTGDIDKAEKLITKWNKEAETADARLKKILIKLKEDFDW